jgi:hypothetical protein
LAALALVLTLPVAVAWSSGLLDSSEPASSSASQPAVASEDEGDDEEEDEGRSEDGDQEGDDREDDGEGDDDGDDDEDDGDEGEDEGEAEGDDDGEDVDGKRRDHREAHQSGDGDGNDEHADVVRRPAGVFVPSLNARRAIVWAVGDGGNGSAVAKRVARRIAQTRPDRVLYLGDVYDWDDAAGFGREYGSVYGRLGRVTAPTPGNHDTPTRKGYEPYWSRIKGKTPPSFYSFRLSGWQILSLNSEVSHGPRSAQVRWLRSRVRRRGTCRLAFWHRPRYSAGTHHGDQGDMAPVWDALRGRARIVLAGHEHDMQRLKPIDGITELVSGAGGKDLYEIDRSDGRLAFANDTQHGALRLELEPGRARFAFVSAGGRTLDSGAVRCRR